jgi:hypothetical protein
MIPFFRRMSWFERLRIRFSRKRRMAYENDLNATIKYLVENPDKPCVIEGVLIRDGFGKQPEIKR